MAITTRAAGRRSIPRNLEPISYPFSQSDSQIFLVSKLEPPDGVDPPPDGAGCRATRRRGFAFCLICAFT